VLPIPFLTTFSLQIRIKPLAGIILYSREVGSFDRLGFLMKDPLILSRAFLSKGKTFVLAYFPLQKEQELSVRYSGYRTPLSNTFSSLSLFL